MKLLSKIISNIFRPQIDNDVLIELETLKNVIDIQSNKLNQIKREVKSLTLDKSDTYSHLDEIPFFYSTEIGRSIGMDRKDVSKIAAKMSLGVQRVQTTKKGVPLDNITYRKYDNTPMEKKYYSVNDAMKILNMGENKYLRDTVRNHLITNSNSKFLRVHTRAA